MSDASSFSPDYTAARARFRAGAHALGCSLEVLSIGQAGPDGEDLTIDVARLGRNDATRLVVVSSGLHGVEGFFGSAVQAALLEDHLGGWSPPPDGALVLMHALNPFGFAWRRRVNEDNIDLNRNFLKPGEDYVGSPLKYALLDGLLNPERPPGRYTAFLPKAAFSLLRYGFPALKQAVAGGQYDYPKGVFFGGSGPSTTHRLLETHMPRWIGKATRVVHLDLHTGLGKSGTYKLFADHPWGSPGLEALERVFGSDVMEPWEPKEGISYQIRGGFGEWCKDRFGDQVYELLCAEFGTVHVLKVMEALHLENRAHHYGDPGSESYELAKDRLYKAFCPESEEWRNEVVNKGLRIIEQAMDHVFA